MTYSRALPAGSNLVRKVKLLPSMRGVVWAVPVVVGKVVKGWLTGATIGVYGVGITVGVAGTGHVSLDRAVDGDCGDVIEVISAKERGIDQRRAGRRLYRWSRRAPFPPH